MNALPQIWLLNGRQIPVLQANQPFDSFVPKSNYDLDVSVPLLGGANGARMRL